MYLSFPPMLSDNHHIDNLQQLFVEVKRYLQLQKEYTQLEIVEKMTILISTLAMAAILIVLAIIGLFYLMLALAYVLEPHVGGLAGSFGLIAGVVVLLMVIAYVLRKQLFVNPMAKFLANLFLNNDHPTET